MTFVRPVVDQALVVDLRAQAADERAGGPHLAGRVLLREHGVEMGMSQSPNLQWLFVGHDEVPDAVHAARVEGRTVEVDICEVGGAKALDKILLDAAGGGDSVGKEDGTAGLGAEAQVYVILWLVI